MKTKEFIKRVEKIGYKTIKMDLYINIYDADNMIAFGPALDLIEVEE